jgi:hypothetical protein
MALAGIFANGTPLPMTGGIAACSVIAFALVKLMLANETDARPVTAA